jgi:hypothetical protein
MRRALIGSLALAVAVGCKSAPPTPVQLQGDPRSISGLAGSWTGEYWGAAGGRGGSLAFSLRSGTDSLFGDVTMVDPRGQPLRSADPSDVHAMHAGSSQQLRIDFVAVRADSVRGTLEPYVSPDCECTVNTTFFGQVRSDKIAGTFVTRSAGRVRAEGSWEMRRVSR